jgi:hypothetical protein
MPPGWRDRLQNRGRQRHHQHQIDAAFSLSTDQDRASIAVSTDNGRTWREVWSARQSGEATAALHLIDEVNGSYEVLVKVTLLGAADPAGAVLTSIALRTVTMLNSKTQPQLKLGRNTVHVGTGDPSESIVVWPELQGDAYKPYVVEEKNVRTRSAIRDTRERCSPRGRARRLTWSSRSKRRGHHRRHLRRPVLQPRPRIADPSAALVRRRRHVERNLDAGRNPPALGRDPLRAGPRRAAGARKVLFKYAWNSSGAGPSACSIYAVRMEVNHEPAVPGFQPLEVTFAWNERQEDYSLVPRSHTQLIERPGRRTSSTSAERTIRWSSPCR